MSLFGVIMKILFYIGSNLVNAVGGAERVFCQMADALAARGHDIYAVCNDPRSGRPFYPLDEQVHFINLDGSGERPISKPATWIKGLRPFLPSICKEMWDKHFEFPFYRKRGEPLVKLIRDLQPDVVLLFWLEDYFSILRQPIPSNMLAVVVSHRSSAEEVTRLIDTRERRGIINTCPHFHVQLSSFLPEIQKTYDGRIHAIPNVVPQLEPKDLADLTVEKPQKTIVMVSRLCAEKQQHLVIESFKRLAEDYPDWKVEFYGPHGRKKYLRQLEKMITRLDLAGRVELKGITERPLEILRNGDIFAFPSLREGFSNALTEAMAVGLPCVGLKTTPSVNELIVDGVNGFLAENTPEDFAQKLNILMDDQNLRVKMGNAGHEMMKVYAPEQIYDQWEKLLFDLTQSSQSPFLNNTANTTVRKAA